MPLTRFVPCKIVTFVIVLFSSAPLPAIAQSPLYNPRLLPNNDEVTDTLSESDIPTGQGGFARDYRVELQAGDQVTIDVSSEDFDTIITLIGEDGSTVGENDDGPNGSTNSLLFTRIAKSGNYILRVRSFGEATGGAFSLKLTRLCPCN